MLKCEIQKQHEALCYNVLHTETNSESVDGSVSLAISNNACQMHEMWTSVTHNKPPFDPTRRGKAWVDREIKHVVMLIPDRDESNKEC